MGLSRGTTLPPSSVPRAPDPGTHQQLTDGGRRAAGEEAQVAERSDDDVLLDGLRMAVGLSVRAADEIDELSPVQLRALTVLRENPRSNLVQMAESMGVTVSTASRLVDRLVAGRLATRKPSLYTRREVTLGLTRSGRSMLQRYDSIRLQSARDCLSHMPAEDRERLIDALRVLVEGVPGVRESPPRGG